MKFEHLYEKVNGTLPGRHAMILREIHYEHSHELGAEAAKQLMDAATYLETLAIEQLKKEVPPWVDELKKRIDGAAKQG